MSKKEFRPQLMVALMVVFLIWFVGRPLSGVALARLGENAEKSGKDARAAFLYEWAVRFRPTDSQVRLRLANLYLGQLKPYEAAQVLIEASESDPKNGRVHNLLGWSYYLMYNLAVPELREAVRLDPMYDRAHYNLGLVAGEKGLWEETEDQFRKVVELNPESPWGYNDLGWALYKQGKIAEARSTLEKAVSLDPSNPWVLNNIGWLRYEQGEASQSVEYFAKVITRTPADIASQYGLSTQGYGPYTQSDVVIITAYYNLGLAYEKLGRKVEAIAAFMEYLSRDEQGRWTRDAKDRIQRLGGTI